MPIRFHESTSTYHLFSDKTSYMMQVVKGKYLVHRYWGKRLSRDTLSEAVPTFGRAFSPSPDPENPGFHLDTLQQEYPAFGAGDYRTPAYQIQHNDGTRITEFVVVSHQVIKGKPKLAGLPATYVEEEGEAETLEITVRDEPSGLTAILSYSVFATYDAIARSVRFVNEGKSRVSLLRALSASVDLPCSDYEMLQLSGAWGRERHPLRRRLTRGTQSIESRRGASSHQQNPFIALVSPGTDEMHGDVYAMNLVYSGNFLAQAEVDQYDTTRLSIGINPFDFRWNLQPGESFQTPEVVLAYSGAGLGQLSRSLHRFYRERLCRGTWRDAERPVLINNWEATYFNFDADKIERIAHTASQLGIELFVLDDGWFGHRDSDNSSLGDWVVDRRKLPQGLDDLARRIESHNMKFGLWFEPEMVSPDSELYRAHPDWCIHVPDRRRTEGRNQLILDLSRQDVCDYIIESVSAVLASASISYVKWDMNRHMTEVGSTALPAEQQLEVSHRYMLGLYRVLEEITSRFPNVLFESCSGGGGRFDPGMLHYMPQTWTSDNTDAVSRLDIQYGTSIAYPSSTMGSHVSAVPNHQVGRITPIQMRGHVAMAGSFGYELDLNQLPAVEQEVVRQQVELYKSIRAIVEFGDLYRLVNPTSSGRTALMYVTPDASEAVLFAFQVLAEANPPIPRVKLQGLRADAMYECVETGLYFGGDELMNVGIIPTGKNADFQSLLWRFRVVGG